MPLVTVVTPAFNAEATIARCIACVGAQTFADWEHIVVDDGSRDGTPAILAEAVKIDSRLRVIDLGSNQGAAAARNRALAEARGRYVAFLDSDDVWLPTKLTAQLGFMERTGSGFTYGAYSIVAQGDAEPPCFFDPPATLDYRRLLLGCPIGCSTVMLDSAAVGQVAMPPIARGQDWALWLALARRGFAPSAFPGIHTVYTSRRGSLSSRKLRKLQDIYRIYREIEGMTLEHSLFCLSRHALYVAFLKRRGMRPHPALST